MDHERINRSYTMYFNVKRKRFVHRFQGRDNAYLVFKDDHALELSRYIHLYTLRAAIVEVAEGHVWSTYMGPYIERFQASNSLEKGYIYGCFGKRISQARREYERFVSDKNRLHDPSPLKKAAKAIWG